MKKLKSMTVIFLGIIIIFSTFVTANAENPEDQNYNLLIEHGFTADYLDGLTDSMINNLVTQIKKASSPEYVSDYDFLISLGFPEEFLKSLSDSALSKIRVYVGDSYVLKLDYKAQKATSSDVLIKKISLQRIDESNFSVLGETVCICWEHEINKPIIRDDDFITASWNSDDFCYESDSFYAEDYRRNSSDESWIVSDSYCVLARSSLNSIGHWTKLYTTKKQVGGFMIFNLSPTHPITSDSDYDRNTTIDYSYETKDFFTVAVCIVFVLLVLSTLWIVTKIRKRKKK